MSADSAIHSLAGAAGGIIAMCSTYPLVFLSTRTAVENKRSGKPLLDVIKDIIKREGVSGLYSGLNSSLLGIALTNGIYYYVYERSRGMMLRSRLGPKSLSTVESILAGMIAGSATTVVTNPVWVIQTSQAVHTMETSDGESKGDLKKPSFFKTLKSIIKKDGPQALLRGIGPALVLVLNPVIQYTVFEQLKNILVRNRTNKLKATAATTAATVAVLSDWDFFTLGALSKLIATSVTYPYIVIKSRLQAGSASAQRYKSSLDGLITVLREEGIAGLYKGVGSKLTQSVLTAAILFAVQRRLYELIKKASRQLLSCHLLMHP